MITALKNSGLAISRIEKELHLSNAALQKVFTRERDISQANYDKLVVFHQQKCGRLFEPEKINQTVGMKSLYNKVAQFGDSLTFSDLYDMRETKLFHEIIEIKDIESSPPFIEEFIYTVERRIKMILFVVSAYSKDSPFMKTSDTVYNIKKNVIEYIGIDSELGSRILEYKIPELEVVIKSYIQREDDYFIREYLTCMSIYDRNLSAASSAIGSDGAVDLKKQSEFFRSAEEFKEKAFRLKQQVENNDSVFYSMKQDFIKSVRSVRCEDLIP